MIDTNLSKRITAMKVANASRVVAILNDLLLLDSNACRTLLQFKVYCNPALLDHPSIQASSHLDDKLAQVGIVGVLNGILTALDIPRVASVYVEGTLVGFQLYESDLEPSNESPVELSEIEASDNPDIPPPMNSDTASSTTNTDGDSSANNDQPQNSDKELPLHRGTKRQIKGSGSKAKAPRNKSNRNRPIDAGIRSGILEVGESISPEQTSSTVEVDPILETYKVEPSLPKPVREL